MSESENDFIRRGLELQQNPERTNEWSTVAHDNVGFDTVNQQLEQIHQQLADNWETHP